MKKSQNWGRVYEGTESVTNGRHDSYLGLTTSQKYMSDRELGQNTPARKQKV
jgi:hypothetical protein